MLYALMIPVASIDPQCSFVGVSKAIYSVFNAYDCNWFFFRDLFSVMVWVLSMLHVVGLIFTGDTSCTELSVVWVVFVVVGFLWDFMFLITAICFLVIIVSGNDIYLFNSKTRQEIRDVAKEKEAGKTPSVVTSFASVFITPDNMTIGRLGRIQSCH